MSFLFNDTDVIMDMLGNPRMRQILTEYYQESEEPKLVQHAIKMARIQRYCQIQSSMESLASAVELAIHGARKVLMLSLLFLCLIIVTWQANKALTKITLWGL